MSTQLSDSLVLTLSVNAGSKLLFSLDAFKVIGHMTTRVRGDSRLQKTDSSHRDTALGGVSFTALESV